MADAIELMAVQMIFPLYKDTKSYIIESSQWHVYQKSQ